MSGLEFVWGFIAGVAVGAVSCIVGALLALNVLGAALYGPEPAPEEAK